MAERPKWHRGQPCHYCGEESSTRDHVVPRVYLHRVVARIEHMQKLMGFREERTALQQALMANVVPACRWCNLAKGRKRSDCPCTTCVQAWMDLGPDHWHDLPVAPVAVLSRQLREQELEEHREMTAQEAFLRVQRLLEPVVCRRPGVDPAPAVRYD